ncbi:nephrin-like isoform X2 [Uloborus diversus]|uniref:nephrin-like isoform X2 n=1 Tax=Uloborus diversus TaxID=327109 RepID=UPI002409265D|nr:nephrin-like isoform X2 [Uloborus diversus]
MNVLITAFLIIVYLYFSGSHVSIVDENGKALMDVIGPVNEGSSLSLLCETNSRVPSVVTWWKGESLLDDSFVTMPRGIIRNELTLSYLDRGDLMSTLTCQASPKNESEASEASVSVDMNLKPLDVHITSLQRPLSAGRKTTLKCQSTGSKPPARISWWIGSKQLLDATEVSYETTTISKLAYVPVPEDHGRAMSCRAVNPVLDGHILEDHRLLNIHYVPLLSVTVGTPQAFILEGDTVYFDCNIDANPPVTAVGWRFKGQPLYSDIKAGIKVQNRSLLLHKINRDHSGNYSCIAANSEDVPYCAPNQKTSFGVPLRNTVTVECLVEANPEAVEFQWFLNNTYRQIPLKSFTVNGTLSSLLYTPKRSSDYGTLMCLAQNSAGLQKEACCYKVSPASVPNAVENCEVDNETMTSAVIRCDPGHDGGLPQEFHLELYTSHGLVTTVVEKGLPEFEINELPTGTSLIALVFAENDYGRSNAVAFTVITKDKHKPVKGLAWKHVSPVIAVLIAVISLLVLVAIIIVVFSKHWSPKSGSPSTWEPSEFKPGHQHI